MPSGITACICDTGQNDAATALITQYKQTVWCSPKLHSVTRVEKVVCTPGSYGGEKAFWEAIDVRSCFIVM